MKASDNKTDNPASQKVDTTARKRSKVKTDRLKKDLLEDPTKEKFEGTLRHKKGKSDQ